MRRASEGKASESESTSPDIAPKLQYFSWKRTCSTLLDGDLNQVYALSTLSL